MSQKTKQYKGIFFFKFFNEIINNNTSILTLWLYLLQDVTIRW